MEGEVHFEESKDLQEKSKKRRLKTPFQLEALENFFNEYKYPTESMKVELGERIGLTEKQISGWFCHRRLKDKKLVHDEMYVNAKHDRSSSVVQDRGSGLRQDSCGSTKLGDSRKFEMREVESQRSCSKYNRPIDLSFELKKQYAGDSSETNNSSSGTSSPVQDRIHAQMAENTYYNRTSRFPALHASATQSNLAGLRMRSHTGPSGYLKVKGDVENSAITAVKKQLGRHYREDGPPLGIDFQQLPPGAFGSPLIDTANEQYDNHDLVHSNAPNFPGRPLHSKQKQRSREDRELPAKPMHQCGNRNRYADTVSRAEGSFSEYSFIGQKDPVKETFSYGSRNFKKVGVGDEHTPLSLDWHPLASFPAGHRTPAGLTSSDEKTAETDASME